MLVDGRRRGDRRPRPAAGGAHLGLDEVPVIRLSHLTPEQVRAYRIADNQLELDAGWDEELLAAEFHELNAAGFDLGADRLRAARSWTGCWRRSTTATVSPAKTSFPSRRRTRCRARAICGCSGDHRLLCGDSTKADDVIRVMHDERAILFATDPPYLVDYDGTNHPGKAGLGTATRTRSHGRVDGDRLADRVELFTEPTALETTMETAADQLEAPTAIRTNLGAIFVSLELSRTSWLITSLSPANGEKMSKHTVRGGDITGLLARFSQLQEKARARTVGCCPIIVIQEAGLDGFWIHRALENEGIESHVVDPASIATSRRRRRAKTDRLDGETLVRTLLAWKRGEPRVCAMVKVPSPEEEDRRRVTRERKVLISERVRHVNRIKGLLFAQGISGYQPLRRDRRERLAELQTGDGRALPAHLVAQIGREIDRLELLLDQIRAVEASRDALLGKDASGEEAQGAATPATAAMLLDIKGIGPEFAALLWSEGLFRHFDNRRQLAAYAGLAPTPWQSGAVVREQGVSKSGNPRVRTTMIQLAWLWLGHQPHSALSRWFRDRVERNGGRLRKTAIVALARKLLVALWKYVTAGVVIEGAEMKLKTA